MRYQFISIFKFGSGFYVPPDVGDLEILKTETTEALLTTNIDPHCVEISRGLALRRVIGHHPFNDDTAKLLEALPGEIDRVNSEREKRFGKSGCLVLNSKYLEYLVIKQQGQAPLEFTCKYFERQGFAISRDVVDEDVLKSTHRQNIASIKAGLGIAYEGGPKFNPVAEALVFFDESGQVIYNVRGKISGGATAGTILRQDQLENLQRGLRRCVKLAYDCEEKSLFRVLTLYSDMLDRNSTELESFVFGWAALEVLIRNTSKKYRKKFFDGFKSDRPNAALKSFIKRITFLVEDKRSIKDDFNFIAAFSDDDASIEEDHSVFSEIKRIRDDYFHSGKDATLPNEEIARLLSKYLRLHFTTK